MDAIGDTGDLSAIHRIGNVLQGPKHNINLGEGLGWYIWNACDKFNEKICQIYAETGESETFSSFKKRATILAVHMKRLGIKKGDVVMACTTNTLDSAIPATAALFMGAIVSSLDPTLSARECLHLVTLVKPKIIFALENYVGLIEETLRATESNCKPMVVVFGKCDGYRSFDEFMMETGEEDEFKPEILEDDHPSFVVFSSGTTGLPKGVCLSQKSIYIGSLVGLICYNYAETLMHFTSFYWISAITLYIGQFVNGATRILVKKFENEITMDYITKYKVAMLFMSPLHAYKITEIDDIKRFDLSSLTTILFGGSVLSAEQITRVRNLLPQTFCFAGFGMTELSGPGAIFFRDDRELAYANPKSCGKPSVGTMLKIVDPETEEPLGPHQSGEIRIKSDSMMLGYYNQDSTTEFDAEGFLKTGDIGHFDENCCVYIYDRIKDMFKYQSWYIVPATIESVVLEHPGVVEAVVVGVPHEKDGHLPAAAVRLHPKCNATPGDIEKFVAERVMDRQRLRGGVFVVDDIPKTLTNKVLRRKVQEMVLQCL